MSNNDPYDIDYDAIRRRVEKRIKQRAAFFKQLGSYLTINFIVWGIWLVTSSDHSGTPWPMWVTIFWGIGIVGQAVNLFLNPSMEGYRERETQREIERERTRRELGEVDDDINDIVFEKPKRDAMAKGKRVVRLGDDGELIDVGPEDDLQQSSANRG